MANADLNMVKLFTIYTENKHKNIILALVRSYVGGFTSSELTGVFGLKEEPVLKIEILGTESDLLRLVNLCATIKRYNNQEEVLLCVTDVGTYVV